MYKKDGFLDKVHSSSDNKNSNQSSFFMDTDPVLLVKPHGHTLRLAVPRLEPLSTIYTSTVDQKAAKDNLSLSQTKSSPMAIERNIKSEDFLAHDKAMTQSFVNTRKGEDKNASRFDTAPMRIIQRKRAKNKIRIFFANLMVLLVGTLFIGLLAAIIIVITGSIAKIEICVIFLIALSYITSLQLKRIHQARKQVYFTITQLLQVSKEMPTSLRDEDVEHLKLIKQDTSTYLQGLIAKDLEKTL